MSSRPIIRRLFSKFQQGGLSWLFKAVYNRLWPARPVLAKTIRALRQDLVCLEIGGPSQVFAAGNILPVYSRALRIDNVNFASQTAWEAGLKDGGEFRFDADKPAGLQYLREATHLIAIADAVYDLVLSSHCLEHVANPLAALWEWRRVARDGGHLLLILPNPKHTFDHRRPHTSFAHLRQDLLHRTGEDDLTHLPEILAHHDLALDLPAGSPEQFRNRSMQNVKNRCLHHHVFDLTLMRAMLDETGWETLALEEVRPIHLIAFARKKISDRNYSASL